MDKISKLAGSVNSALQNGQQNTESAQNGSGQSKKRMLNLWERMTHIYGHRWTASFGETAIDDAGELTDAAQTWASGLHGLTGEQIARGLHSCVDDASNEWPSLPMFKAKCTKSELNEFGLDYVPEMYRTNNCITDKDRLLRDKTHKERCAEVEPHLSALRRALRGKK